MRILITICGLVAAAFFGWQYSRAQEANASTEALLSEAAKQHASLTQELFAAKNDLQQASNQLAALDGVRSQPVPKTNWIDERNRNWNTSLKGGRQ